MNPTADGSGRVSQVGQCGVERVGCFVAGFIVQFDAAEVLRAPRATLVLFAICRDWTLSPSRMRASVVASSRVIGREVARRRRMAARVLGSGSN